MCAYAYILEKKKQYRQEGKTFFLIFTKGTQVVLTHFIGLLQLSLDENNGFQTKVRY